ncbi:MAG: AbrB/MazE/SpoVT family DNA-binding domain-containing protein [Nitrososphaerales archaeon]
MPDEPIVAVTKVSEKGLVQIPLNIREKLDLKPGMKMVVIATEDVVVLKKFKVPVAKKVTKSFMQRIQSIFSKVPIRDIEE